MAAKAQDVMLELHTIGAIGEGSMTPPASASSWSLEHGSVSTSPKPTVAPVGGAVRDTAELVAIISELQGPLHRLIEWCGTAGKSALTPASTEADYEEVADSDYDKDIGDREALDYDEDESSTDDESEEAGNEEV